jgi:hypothetical protein
MTVQVSILLDRDALPVFKVTAHNADRQRTLRLRNVPKDIIL